MLCILTYNEIDRAQWKTLVQTSTTGSWFQTPEAYDFFASQPELFRPFVIGIGRKPNPNPSLKGREQDPNTSASLSEVSTQSTSLPFSQGVASACHESTSLPFSQGVASACHESTSLPFREGAGLGSLSLRAICVGYVTVEKNALKQFFTRRAIIFGGPCLADDCTDEEVTGLLSTLISQLSTGSNAPIYIETRNFNDYSRWRNAFEAAGFNYQPHLNFHIACSNKSEMDQRISEMRHRQMRKALRSGVEIVETETGNVDEQMIREWYNILYHLYRTKVKTPLPPLSFFLRFYRDGVGQYILVRYQGKVIGGVMCPMMKLEQPNPNPAVIYEWYICGLDTDYKDQAPSVMATYAAMQYANRHQINRFDVMGAGVPGVPYGVRDFKAEFGGQLVEHGRWLYVSKPFLYHLGVLGLKILRF